MTDDELLEGVIPVWESDRYDMPLAGHAWYKGDYGTFNLANAAEAFENDAQPLYAFSKAKTVDDAVRLLAMRQLFEDMVGHHCTYGVSHVSFNENEAIDFNGYYGVKGKPRHPYVIAAKDEAIEVEFVGYFRLKPGYRW